MNINDNFSWRRIVFTYVSAMQRWEPIAAPSHSLDAYVYQFIGRPGFAFVATIKSNPGMRTGRGDTPLDALDKAFEGWEAFLASLPPRPRSVPPPIRYKCATCWRGVRTPGQRCDTCQKADGLGG